MSERSRTAPAARVFGLHAVEALLAQEGDRLLRLLIAESRSDRRLQTIRARAGQLGIQVISESRATLDSLTGGGNHQGVIAELRSERQAVGEEALEQILIACSDPLFLILDGVQDPHNLGAALRSADAAGAAAVIVPRDRACGLNATVRKVACGAAERVPLIQVTNLARTLRMLRESGVWLVGFALESGAPPHYQARLTGPLALLLGGEERGLRRLTREGCDQLVQIPMAGQMQSLNVSVACGIALFEALRQRQIAAGDRSEYDARPA
jgi:23S rRNA (guanosine2251-2'-O)-methyltransferase